MRQKELLILLSTRIDNKVQRRQFFASFSFFKIICMRLFFVDIITDRSIEDYGLFYQYIVLIELYCKFLYNMLNFNWLQIDFLKIIQDILKLSLIWHNMLCYLRVQS